MASTQSPAQGSSYKIRYYTHDVPFTFLERAYGADPTSAL